MKPPDRRALEPWRAAEVHEELTFHPSPDASVGIELELPVLDRESGELVPGAPRILAACQEDGLCNVDAELMQSMLEVRTGICRNVLEARTQLVPALRRVRNIAGSLGYDMALLGTHPFLRPSTSALSPASERFESALVKLAWMTYYRVAFGLHVHVGVRSGDQAISIINNMMQYLPHLLALSANSPFWQGVDTGLASCRAALYGLVPHAGVPGVFSKWKEFRKYYQVMRECRTTFSAKDIKWDIRPRPDLGTLEFRICDMPVSLPMVLKLATLTRCLVIATQRLLAERPHLRGGDRRRQWITVENKWLASRYGLKAMYIRSPSGKRGALLDDLEDLVDRLLPIARESGDDRFLNGLKPVDRIESGAERQRQLYRDSGNWKAVMTELVRRLSEDLDRAAAAMAPPAAPQAVGGPSGKS